MNTIETVYPQFVPNQVLTNTQLNQLRRQLDEQDRLGRIRLSGTGIVCGLTWTFDEPAGELRIAEGYGVTSDGYIAELGGSEGGPRVYTQVLVDYLDPERDEDGIPDYEPFQPDGAVPLSIHLLLEADEDPPEDPIDPPPVPPASEPLTAAHLADRVIVLYLERRPQALDSCLVTSCDNQGVNVSLIPRVLLIRREDLDRLELPLPGPTRLTVPRLHTARRLQSIGGAEEIDEGYRELVAALSEPLGEAILDAYERYRRILGNAGGVADLVAPRIGEIAAAGQGNQYLYAAARDLTTGYNEFVSAACELIGPCCPELDFPRHLMLGDTGGTPGYRNRFTASPHRNVLHGDLERIRRLLARLVFLNQALLEPPVDGDLRLTPSQVERFPLGERARPIYYRDGFPPDSWNPSNGCSAFPSWSYYDESEDRALDAEYAAASLIRIEGHVGRELSEAVTGIETARQERNVEFDLLTTWVEDPTAQRDAISGEMRELLTEREATVRRELADFLRSSPDDPDDFGPMLERVVVDPLKGGGELDRRIRDLLQQLEGIHRARAPHCDGGGRQAAYAEARTELTCALSALHGHVATLRDAVARMDAELADDVSASFLDSIRLSLIPAVTRWLAARTAAWLHTDAELPEQVTRVLRDVLGRDSSLANLIADAEGRARVAIAILELALETLSMNLQELRGRFLPEDVDDVCWDLLRDVHAELVADAIHLGLMWRTMGEELAELLSTERSAPHPDLLDAAAGALLEADHGTCLRDRIGAVVAHRDAARRSDLSTLANLAERYPGLEHAGGVQPGGTFVLVASDDGEGNDEVVADFALASRVSCCCTVDEPGCLPLVAHPDVHLVALDDDGRVRVDAEIDVLANDHDLHDREVGLSIEVEDTEVGGSIEERDGRLRYRMDEASPGLIDRVTYTFRADGDGRGCEESVRAHVIVLMDVIEPDVAPEPPTEPGRVRGRVENDSGDPVRNARVDATDEGGVVVDSVRTENNGRFDFRTLAGPANWEISVDEVGSGCFPPAPQTIFLPAGGDVENVDFLVRCETVPADTFDLDFEWSERVILVGGATAVRITLDGSPGASAVTALELQWEIENALLVPHRTRPPEPLTDGVEVELRGPFVRLRFDAPAPGRFPLDLVMAFFEGAAPGQAAFGPPDVLTFDTEDGSGDIGRLIVRDIPPVTIRPDSGIGVDLPGLGDPTGRGGFLGRGTTPSIDFGVASRRAVTDVDGIGRRRAEELERAGITTVLSLLMAAPETVAAILGTSEATAEGIQATAAAMVEMP